MQSYSTLFLVFLAVCFVVVSGRPNNKAIGDGVQLSPPPVDVNNLPEPRPAPAIVESEDDKKLLLTSLALKPLAIVAGGLLTNGNNQKKPSSIPIPPTATVPTENNIMVVINSNDQIGKSETDDEPRKLLIPMAAVKPLIIGSVMTGTKLAKLPAITLPKIDFKITKHEYPNKPTINITTS